MSDEREQAIEASGDTAIALAERLRRIGIDGLKRARIDRSIDEDWCRDEIAAADYITRSESVLQAELDAAREEASLLRFGLRRLATWMDLDPDWPGFDEDLAGNFPDAADIAPAIRNAFGLASGDDVQARPPEVTT